MSRLAFLPLALVMLPGCPLLDVDTEVAETCATYHDVQVAAVPIARSSLTQSFTLDQLQTLQQLASLDATLTFTHADVHATSGITDFSFVTDVSLAIASGDPSSTLPTATVFDCNNCGTADPTLDVASNTVIDAKDYVTSGSLIVTVDLAGQPPAIAWTMDVDVCMTGNVSYTYSP